jgi:predicted ATP-dependent protease
MATLERELEEKARVVTNLERELHAATQAKEAAASAAQARFARGYDAQQVTAHFARAAAASAAAQQPTQKATPTPTPTSSAPAMALTMAPAMALAMAPAMPTGGDASAAHLAAAAEASANAAMAHRELLHELGLRSSTTFVSTSGEAMLRECPKKIPGLIASADNGVLFIDEAYQLDPAKNSEGKAIVNQLLTAAEEKRETLSIIFAGYKDDTEEKLYVYSCGLQSRFQWPRSVSDCK